MMHLKVTEFLHHSAGVADVKNTLCEDDGESQNGRICFL